MSIFKAEGTGKDAIVAGIADPFRDKTDGWIFRLFKEDAAGRDAMQIGIVQALTATTIIAWIVACAMILSMSRWSLAGKP